MTLIFDPRRAIISREKVTGYLLSTAHPVGRHKAAFFATMGYTAAAPDVFERDVADLLRAPSRASTMTPFGQKFSTRGRLVGPNGRAARVVAVWIIITGEECPRLITAYPED